MQFVEFYGNFLQPIGMLQTSRLQWRRRRCPLTLWFWIESKIPHGILRRPFKKERESEQKKYMVDPRWECKTVNRKSRVWKIIVFATLALPRHRSSSHISSESCKFQYWARCKSSHSHSRHAAETNAITFIRQKGSDTGTSSRIFLLSHICLANADSTPSSATGWPLDNEIEIYSLSQTICILTWSDRASFAPYRWYRMMASLLFRTVTLADMLHVNYSPNWVYLSNQYAIISSCCSTFWQWTFQYHSLTVNLWNETKVTRREETKFKKKWKEEIVYF